MPKRSRSLPDWFDLKNYESLQQATLLEWVVELKNRRQYFRVLLEGEAALLNGSPGFPRAKRFWEQIRRDGMISRAGAEYVRLPASTWADADQKLIYDTEGSSAERPRPVVSHEIPGLSDEEPLPIVSRLTKGDVVQHLLFSGEMEGLAQGYIQKEWAGADAWSSVPFEELGWYGLNSSYNRFVKIDITAPDDMILAEVKAWLSERRSADRSKGAGAPRLVTEADLAEWCKYKLLPYIDLTFASRFEGCDLTHERIGHTLFPDEIDVTLAERVRKVLRPKAQALMAREFLDGLTHQYEKQALESWERKRNEQKGKMTPE